MKTHDAITRKVFHSIHKNQIISKIGFKKIKNLLSCENLKLAKSILVKQLVAHSDKKASILLHLGDIS